MSHKKAKKDRPEPNVIPQAGMRPDKRRRGTGAAMPDRSSLEEEICWRVEHSQ